RRFRIPSFAPFAVLQSRVHEIWARFFSSSMKDDLRYAPSDCFETFPFPAGYETDPDLETVGQTYHDHRASLMDAANEGKPKPTTAFTNRTNAANRSHRLPELHDEMDRAVLRAYNWRDLAEELRRVMALVPPKELEGIMGAWSSEGINARNEIGLLVSKGYESWQRFDEEYRANADRIRSQDAGHAQWEDIANFLMKHAAERGPSTTRTSFVLRDQDVEAMEEQLATVKIGDAVFAVGELDGISSDPIVQQLALNVPLVAQKLREAFLPDRVAGAAYLTRPALLPGELPRGSFGLLGFLRQTLRSGERATEDRLSFHTYLMSADSTHPLELDRKLAFELIKRLHEASRIREPQPIGVEAAIEMAESTILQEMRRPSESDLAERIRHVVWPLAAIVVV
ncbi:MAG: type IIL restriction-modification enzyme MmeI, partial [Roseiarcus sp.]